MASAPAPYLNSLSQNFRSYTSTVQYLGETSLPLPHSRHLRLAVPFNNLRVWSALGSKINRTCQLLLIANFAQSTVRASNYLHTPGARSKPD